MFGIFDYVISINNYYIIPITHNPSDNLVLSMKNLMNLMFLINWYIVYEIQVKYVTNSEPTMLIFLLILLINFDIDLHSHPYIEEYRSNVKVLSIVSP